MVYDCVLDGVTVKDEWAEGRLKVGDVTFNGLVPFLTPALLWEPSGIGSEVDELLVDGLVHEPPVFVTSGTGFPSIISNQTRCPQQGHVNHISYTS